MSRDAEGWLETEQKGGKNTWLWFRKHIMIISVVQVQEAVGTL